MSFALCNGSRYSLNSNHMPFTGAESLKEFDMDSACLMSTDFSTDVPSPRSSVSRYYEDSCCTWDALSSPSLSLYKEPLRSQPRFGGSLTIPTGRPNIPISFPKVHRMVSSSGTPPHSQGGSLTCSLNSNRGQLTEQVSSSTPNAYNCLSHQVRNRAEISPEDDFFGDTTEHFILEPPRLGVNGPWPEEKCREVAAVLERSTQRAAAKLGAADPVVEQVHDRVRQLRHRADSLRWNAIVAQHRLDVLNCNSDVEAGADISVLDDAVKRAASSELGPGHEIVQRGKQLLKGHRLKHRLDRQSELSITKMNNISEAINAGDISALCHAINEAANVESKHIPEVNAARETLRRMRSGIECGRRMSLVEEHHALMLQACATKNVGLINERIWHTAHSELGFGHPIVNIGRGCVRTLRLQAKQAEQDSLREECMSALLAAQE